MAKYSGLPDLAMQRLADAALAANWDSYIVPRLQNYQNYRDGDTTAKTLALCGHGRAGKDIGANYLQSTFDIRFESSTSRVALPLVAHALEMEHEACYADRHNNRLFWFNFCNAVRRTDPTLLVQLVLAESDVVVGVRSFIELHAALERGLIDVAVWVQNDRVEEDPTTEYTADDCDLVIHNNGSIRDYYRHLAVLGKLMGFQPKLLKVKVNHERNAEEEN